MSPCHNLEPSLVARDSSRLLSVKPNEWMHLSPFYTRMHGEWLRYAKSTSQFHWRFLLVRDVRGFQVNPLCRHDITSPFPPSGNGGYVRNLDVLWPLSLGKTMPSYDAQALQYMSFNKNDSEQLWIINQIPLCTTSINKPWHTAPERNSKLKLVDATVNLCRTRQIV